MRIPAKIADPGSGDAHGVTDTPASEKTGMQAMAEHLVTLCPGVMPHRGLASPDRPVDCLRTVPSPGSFNPLARACGVPYDPPGTAGEVPGLYTGGRLREIRSLGQRRISEIGEALVLVGLDITGDAQQPLAALEHGKTGQGS